MSDWSNPVSTALGTLVRKTLQSLGFVSGSTGWQITRNGNAEFNQAIFRGSVFVTTASSPGGSIQLVSGTRIPNELVIYYNPIIISTVEIFFDNGTGSYLYIANLEDGRQAIGVVNGLSAVKEIFHFSSSNANNGIASHAIVWNTDGLGTEEIWHGLAYQNGWADNGSTNVTGRYRMIPSPANTVQIIGTLNAGTKADNTVVANLPVPYRPAKTISFPVGMAAPLLGGGSLPMFQVFSNGDMTCVGCVNATLVWLDALIPLDA